MGRFGVVARQAVVYCATSAASAQKIGFFGVSCVRSGVWSARGLSCDFGAVLGLCLAVRPYIP